MRISLRGIKLIAQREGAILHVYKDSKGLPTAGVGHLITEAEHAEFPVGKKVSQDQSDTWLAADLKECEDAINESIKPKLEQHEFDALASLAFNIGVNGFKKSSVVRNLNRGDMVAGAKAILLWDQPPEIRGRRRGEYNQFLTPYPISAQVPAVDLKSDGSIANNPPVNPTQPPTDGPQAPNASTHLEVKDGSLSLDAETKPTGEPASSPATQVSQNGGLARTILGGSTATALAGAVTTWATGHIDGVAVIVICLTLIVLAILFRGTIIDWIRMQSHADPNKFNVK